MQTHSQADRQTNRPAIKQASKHKQTNKNTIDNKELNQQRANHPSRYSEVA